MLTSSTLPSGQHRVNARPEDSRKSKYHPGGKSERLAGKRGTAMKGRRAQRTTENRGVGGSIPPLAIRARGRTTADHG